MHILHIIPGDLWAGAESQLFYTLREIKRQCNHSISVILFNSDELYRCLSHENINVMVIDEKECSSFEIIRHLTKILSLNSIDILHTHEYKSHILGILAKIASGKKIPVTRTLHGRTSVPLGLKNLKSYLVLHMENFFLRFFTQHIIAVSNDLKIDLENTFSRPAIHHINNAVDSNWRDVKKYDTIREELGIDGSSLWIVCAARLERVKNLDMLIESVKLVEEKDSAAKITVSIFGDGDLRESLEEKVRTLSLEDMIQFHGHCKNIFRIFNDSDVFTLTSHDEGLPMSLLEAMSLGSVPVCTRVGGMKEVIRDGENGFLVESGNSSELAEVLIFINNNRDRLDYLRPNAVNTITANYSLETNVAKLLELYSSIYKAECASWRS